MPDFNSAHTAAEFDDAVGVAKATGTGVLVKTAPGAGVVRTITASNGIALTHGDGVAGAPDLQLTAAVLTSLALADTATQPGDLATVATSGAYADLSGTPTIPTTALPVVHVNVIASKTLALSDSEVEQRVNSASAVVLTIPTNVAVAYADNAKIPVMGIGTGTVTITASAGVTLNGVSAGSVALSAQYSAAVLTKVGTDAWVVNGDRGAVA